MAKLKTKERAALPRYQFGLPEKRAFPMPDENHVRAALSGAPRSYAAGNISKAEEQTVEAKAESLLKSRYGGKK
jgi:hypothetical protein